MAADKQNGRDAATLLQESVANPKKMTVRIPAQRGKGSKVPFALGEQLTVALRVRLAEALCSDQFKPRTMTVKKGPQKGTKYRVYEVAFPPTTVDVLDADGIMQTLRAPGVTYTFGREKIS